MKKLSIKILIVNLFKNFWVQEFLLFLAFYSLRYSEFFKNWISLQTHNDKGIILSIFYIVFALLNIILFALFIKMKRVKIRYFLFVLCLPLLSVIFNIYIIGTLIIPTIWLFANILLFIGGLFKKKIMLNIYTCLTLFIIPLFILAIMSAFMPKLQGQNRDVNTGAIADLGNINSAAETFYIDNNYFPSASNGECLKISDGVGDLFGVYLEGGKIPLYGYAKSDFLGEEMKQNIFFCSKNTPILYMPWKMKEVGTREYWYKTLTYKEKADEAYLLCAEVNDRNKLNAKQGIENTTSYEEAKKYMELYKDPAISWKETEELMDEYRNTTEVYIYCLLKHSGNL